MIITQTHLDFWQSKQHQPSWTRPLLTKKAASAEKYHAADLIDLCINANASVGLAKFNRSHAHTETLIGFARRFVRAHDRAGLIDFLQRFGSDNQLTYHRRSATARKWLARLEGGKGPVTTRRGPQRTPRRDRLTP